MYKPLDSMARGNSHGSAAESQFCVGISHGNSARVGSPASPPARLPSGQCGRLQVRAESQQTAIAILHHELTRVPWHVGKAPSEHSPYTKGNLGRRSKPNGRLTVGLKEWGY